MVSLVSCVAGAQTTERTGEQNCGRTHCLELARTLTAGVTATTDEFEVLRARLHPKEVHRTGPFSRLALYLARVFGIQTPAPGVQTGKGPVSGPLPQLDGDTLNLFKASDIENLLSATKKTLIKNLRNNLDFFPLITYIQRTFPSAPAAVQIRGGHYVETNNANKFLDTVKLYLSHLAAKGPGPVNLHFTSTPRSGANVSIRTYEHPIIIDTENWIHNLPRGAYEYEVKRDRFKTGKGWLDAENDDRENVECRLQDDTSSQESVCAFK
jgi:hypothetical protein